jgi:predicted dehydrogenase
MRFGFFRLMPGLQPLSPAPSPLPTAPRPSRTPVHRRTRYAFVGTGGRVKMFLDPVADQFAGQSEIVGLCDLSLARASVHQQRLQTRYGYARVPVFRHTDFDRLLAETRPDIVVVCTIDREHDAYILAALQAGCDVITEKPMTISAEKCTAILRAAEKSGRSIRVAFNYRWGSGASQVREVLAEGAIGAVRQVTMEYLLNTSHGADYFRRWHANKADSGGLLVHKSTHHFDLVNWWIDAIPEEVFAYGALAFYGRDNALRRGDGALATYPRYLGHEGHGDPFAYDYARSMIQDPSMERALYLGAAEVETGYIRDRNVFRDDITIEDAMTVLVRYRTGVLLNYSLNAFSPYEGFRVAFAGDRGRLEYEESHGAHIVGESREGNEHLHAGGATLRVLPHFKEPFSVTIPPLSGAHGGADALLQEQLFSPAPPADPLRRAAGHEQGAASILVGVAANRSMATGQAVRLASLVALRPGAERLSELI